MGSKFILQTDTLYLQALADIFPVDILPRMGKT